MPEPVAVVTFGLEWRLNNAAVRGRCPLLLTDFSPSWGEWLFCARTGLPVDMDALSESGSHVNTTCPDQVVKRLKRMEKDPSQPWGKAGRIDYALPLSDPLAPRMVFAQLHAAFTDQKEGSDEDRIRLLALAAPVLSDIASPRPDSMWQSVVRGVTHHLPALVQAAPVLLPHLDAFRAYLPVLASHLSQTQLQERLPRSIASLPKSRF